MSAPMPLSGIKILDLSKLAPGPHCTMILGDLGADIVKIEEPGPPDRQARPAGGSGRLFGAQVERIWEFAVQRAGAQ